MGIYSLYLVLIFLPQSLLGGFTNGKFFFFPCGGRELVAILNRVVREAIFEQRLKGSKLSVYLGEMLSRLREQAQQRPSMGLWWLSDDLTLRSLKE